MAVFIITLGVLLLVVVGMAVGVMLGRKPLAGSCGGVGKALGEKDYTCELCGGDEAKCEELKQAPVDAKKTADKLAYDATKA